MAEPTVADLAERYLRMHMSVQCKASSKSRYERLLRNQILPALAEMRVGSVSSYLRRAEGCGLLWPLPAELVTDDAEKLKEQLEQATGERISALERIGAPEPAREKPARGSPRDTELTLDAGAAMAVRPFRPGESKRKQPSNARPRGSIKKSK